MRLNLAHGDQMASSASTQAAERRRPGDDFPLIVELECRGKTRATRRRPVDPSRPRNPGPFPV